MKNKGFTLIELLAVILILGIIALIGIPTVNNIINEAKLNSKVETTNGIIDAIDNYSVISAIKGSSLVKGKTIEFNSDGTAHFSGETEIIDLGLKGEKPTSGKAYIDTLGNITVEGLVYDNNIICNMTKGDKGCFQATINNDGYVTDNKAISYIKSKAGTALVDDPSDSNTRMIFRGDNNIHNYINIIENNIPIKYRIVSIESDGTFKVIRDDIESSKPWDQTDIVGEQATTGPRLNLDNTYCMKWNEEAKTYGDGLYYGCNAWNAVDGLFSNGLAPNPIYTGTVTQNATLNDYLNNDFYNKIDKKMQNLIITHSFDTGEISWGTDYNIIASDIKKKSWQGKIGLVNGLDWFNASDSSTGCITDLNSKGWYSSSKTNINETHATDYPCSDKNYLYKSAWWWTLSTFASSRYDAFNVSGSSSGYFNTSNTYDSGGVRPTFYITSNINLSGEGTSDSPFIIK